MDSSTIDHNLTVRVNIIRAFAAGLVWGIAFALGLLFLGLLMWFLEPEGEWPTVLLTAPLVGMGGLFMPLAFLTMTLLIDFLLAPLDKFANKLGFLGFVLGIFVPTNSSILPLLVMLVMIVGDPLVYLLWRIFPSFIPVREYRLIMFSSYIRVKQA